MNKRKCIYVIYSYVADVNYDPFEIIIASGKRIEHIFNNLKDAKSALKTLNDTCRGVWYNAETGTCEDHYYIEEEVISY